MSTPARLRKGRAKLTEAAVLDEFLLRPDPLHPCLTELVAGRDEQGREVETRVVVERPLTLFLNGQEIVTMMTIGDYPHYLAVGYLLNQNMLRADDVIEAIDHDEELETVVVRTARETDYEETLKKKVRTSGCALPHDSIRHSAASTSGSCSAPGDPRSSTASRTEPPSCSSMTRVARSNCLAAGRGPAARRLLSHRRHVIAPGAPARARRAPFCVARTPDSCYFATRRRCRTATVFYIK